MHRPTRRPKRCKRPSSSIYLSADVSSSSRVIDRLTTGNTDVLEVPAEGASLDIRHSRASNLDAIRGATLVALIVVTIVLYLTLWELERSSFAFVPSPSPLVILSNNVVSRLGGESVSLELQASMPAAVTSSPVSNADQWNMPSNHDGKPANTPDRLTRSAWPPPITRVPDEKTEDVDEIDNDGSAAPSSSFQSSIISFDTTYCNGPCHFLLPIRIAEQESKARLHFAQLLTLAQKMNRTLVLPNVGKSRMGICLRWPFGAYYDTDVLAFTLAGSSTRSPGFPPTMDLAAFRNWTEGRPVVPSSYVVSMEALSKGHWRAPGPLETPDRWGEASLVVDETGINPKVLSCLEAKLPRLRSSLPPTALSISFDSGQLKRASFSAPGARLMQLLSGRLGLEIYSDLVLGSGLGPLEAAFDFTNPGYEDLRPFIDSYDHSLTPLPNVSVLIINYDLRHPLFDEPSAVNLHYAPALYDLADRLADNTGPFLGVHWRMENVPVQNLAWCAASLVSVLHGLLQDDIMGENVRHVWLATDYPYLFPTDADSASFTLDKDDGAGEDGGERERSRPRHGTQKSSTFRIHAPEHDDAIAVLREAFQPGGDLDAWKLSGLSEQLRRYPYVEGKFGIDEGLLEDAGVYGILDKLVVVQSQVFVSGSKECSKVSSFSKQIVEARQELLEAESRSDIRNVIEYFGEW